MPDIRSKKTGKQYTKQSLYDYQVEGNPEYRKYTPDQIWEAAQSDPNYEMAAGTDAPPSFSAVNMVKNLPGSLWNQQKESVKGIASLVKNFGPYAMNDPESAVNRMASDPSFIGQVQETLPKIPDAIADDYKNFYLGGNFLHNLEQDPGRVVSDVAMVSGPIGWATRAAKLGRVASAVSKLGAAADFVTSPIPAASKAATTMLPPVLNRSARHMMDYGLSLPKGEGGVGLKLGETLRDLALTEGHNTSKAGMQRSLAEYETANQTMAKLTDDATKSGLRFDPLESQTHLAGPAYAQGIHSTEERASRVKSANKLLADPLYFGQLDQDGKLILNQKGNPALRTITPNEAAEMRTNLNTDTKPDRGGPTFSEHNQSEWLKAKEALADSLRDQLGVIPGQRDAALRAFHMKKLAEAAERVQLAQRGSAPIDHATAGTLGAAGKAIATGMPSPLALGWGAKNLHTPERMSKLAGAIFVKDPAALKGRANLFEQKARTAVGAARAVSRKDQSRPFSEYDRKQPDPSRPFQEE